MDACLRLSRRSLLPLLLVLACAGGCSRATPAGPYGEPIDLKPYLPAGVSPPAEAQTTKHRARVEVGRPPALVDVEWRSFQHGAEAYILSVAASVYRPAEGVHLNGFEVEDTSRFRGSDGGMVQRVALRMSWVNSTLRATQGGSRGVAIRADGAWQ